MAPQKKKHNDNQLRGLYTHLQNRECPSCGEVQSRVKESRRVFDGIRRRYECLKCDYRYTTYELSSDVYEELRALRNKITQLHAVFNDLTAPVAAEASSPVQQVAPDPTDTEIPCADCAHLMSYGCSFDIPEAQTEDAQGCNLFQPNSLVA